MLNRRQLLGSGVHGLAGLALSDLARRESGAGLHHPPRAKAVIQLFMSGAASQCDLFDHGELLERHAGEAFDPGGELELFQSSPGVCMPSPWAFRQRGESGAWISDLCPRISMMADEIAFIRSMVSETNVHGTATFLGTTGFTRPGYPSMGSWISWGLGSLNDDLPTFVSLPDERGLAPGGGANWGAGFLPAQAQGVAIQPGRDEPLAHLFAPDSRAWAAGKIDQADISLLETLAGGEGATPDAAARVSAYRMAARLQLTAPEALDLGKETSATRRLFGLDEASTADLGRRCLVARRLVERGVRFVQVWSGADNGFPRRNWDSHEDIERDHGSMGRAMDHAAGALLSDLKARGLLDEVIVLWTTEFGRMPCSQGAKGRDHNPFGYTSWLSGGGVSGGSSRGATDGWSFRAVQDPTSVHDVHATVLHLMGVDHERLTVRHNGLDQRLTDVHGSVLGELLA